MVKQTRALFHRVMFMHTLAKKFLISPEDQSGLLSDTMTTFCSNPATCTVACS